MHPEDQLLLTCTRQDYGERHQSKALQIARDHSLDWERVFLTAENHGVAPLVHVNLQNTPGLSDRIPTEIAHKFQLAAYRNSIRNEQKSRRLAKSLDFFAQHAIEVMLVKGEALNLQVYDHPWYTVPMDTDLVLQPQRNALPEATIQEINHVHHRSGIEFDFFEHHDVTMNGTLPVDFKLIWQDAQQAQFRGRDIRLMAPEDLLITICINSCRKRYFRLKSLCDIAEITHRTPGLSWNTLVQKEQLYDCTAIVYCALYITHHTLGLAIQPTVWQALSPPAPRRAMIQFLTKTILGTTPLSSLYPISGVRMLDRAISRALLLTYATYRPYQAWHKLRLLVSREA